MKNCVFACIGLFLLSSFTFHNSNFEGFSDDEVKITHRIQLGLYKEIVPIKIVELMRQMEGVTPFKSLDGSVYLTAPYSNEEAAAKDLPNLKSLGFDNAQQVVAIDDQLLSIEQYHQYYDENAESINGRPSVIRIWR